MSIFVIGVIIFLVLLFAIISFIPDSYKESDSDSLVQMQD